MTDQQYLVEIELRNRIAELEEQIIQLKKMIGAEQDYSFVERAREVFGISPGQARILQAVAAGGSRSKETLMAAYTEAGHYFPSDNCLKVQIHRLRASLARHSIKLHNIFGYGYVMDEPNQEALRAMMGDAV